MEKSFDDVRGALCVEYFNTVYEPRAALPTSPLNHCANVSC